MNKISLVFFGAGPVASKSLEFLAENFNIEAVVTKPKPAHHKGDAPVFDLAGKLNIPIITAANKTELDEKLSNSKFVSSMGLIIDFGIIVSNKVIDKFTKGIVNSHFSLLPEWRGADPITFSLLSGQKFTGVSLMLLVEAMDEGPILAQETIAIDTQDTGLSLTNKLITLSNKMLLEYLPRYYDGYLKPVEQIEYAKTRNINAEPSYSSKILKETGMVDWTMPGEQIEREIRAYQPWPKSYTKIGEGLSIIILKSQLYEGLKLNPGEIKIDSGRLIIGTKTSPLEILEVQPYGKNKMSASDFLRGYMNKLFVQKD